MGSMDFWNAVGGCGHFPGEHARGSRVESTETGRRGTVVTPTAPDSVQVEWDDGTRSVVPMDRTRPEEEEDEPG